MVPPYLKFTYCMLFPFRKLTCAGESKVSFSLVWPAAAVVIALSGRRRQWFRKSICLVRENAGGLSVGS